MSDMFKWDIHPKSVRVQISSRCMLRHALARSPPDVPVDRLLEHHILPQYLRDAPHTSPVLFGGASSPRLISAHRLAVMRKTPAWTMGHAKLERSRFSSWFEHLRS